MKVEKISNYMPANKINFANRFPKFSYNAVDSFMAMENKAVAAEIDLIRALSKKNPKLHAIIKNSRISKYDVPLLKTLLINPVFDNEKVYEAIPQMLSIKWAWEDLNKGCAIGRKNIADLYATTPILNRNKVFQDKIGEIILNCATKESSEYTIKLINKYLSNRLYENKNLSEKLPDVIIKLQDSLYESRIDRKGVSKALDRCLDFYTLSPSGFNHPSYFGDAVLNEYLLKAL